MAIQSYQGQVIYWGIFRNREGLLTSHIMDGDSSFNLRTFGVRNLEPPKAVVNSQEGWHNIYPHDKIEILPFVRGSISFGGWELCK